MALKILLADDNITAQKMGSKILTDAGYQVVAVSNGAAAMKKIASEKPELLILDVYMPGYNGLEVCQKTKSAPETAAVPVVLTVTNMEPFNPEDGNKVKADGVMIKPFEATDLLAIVQKFEARLRPAAPPAPPPEAEYEKTQKMAALGFQDASYEEWKAEAPPEEAEAAPRVAVPQEMAAAPALGMEDMLAEAAPPAPAFAAAAGAETAPPAEVEFTSAPQVGEIEIERAPELELNGHAAAAAEVQIVQDPALVTNAEDMAQFVTKFGDAPGQPSYSLEEPVAPPAPEAAAAPEITELAPNAFEEPVQAAPVQEELVAFEEPVQAAPVQEEPVAFEEPVQAAPVQEEPLAFEEPVQAEPVQEEPVAFEELVQAAPVQAVPVVVEPAPEPEFAPAAESGVSLEDEMRRAFDAGGGAAAAPALAPEPEAVAAPEPETVAAPEPVEEAPPIAEAPAAPTFEPPSPPPPSAAIPDKLVEQFAAELAQFAPGEAAAEEAAPPEPVAESAPPQAAAPALDEQRVSEAVQRVMSRYKDELVAAIVRELKS